MLTNTHQNRQDLSLTDFEAASLSSPLSGCVFLVPNYVSEGEEERLLTRLSQTKGWKHVSGRRVLSLGGSVTKSGLLPAMLPSWLQDVVRRVSVDTGAWDLKEANHVLVNAYNPGTGIQAHEDGPSYAPVVCILSLGAPATMQFDSKVPEGAPVPVLRVFLPPRSLLVFRGAAYTNCLHGIKAVGSDSDGGEHNMDSGEISGAVPGQLIGDRYSLTIRRVNRVIRGLRL